MVEVKRERENSGVRIRCESSGIPPNWAALVESCKPLAGAMSGYVNQTYHRSGTLWEDRYHASLVQGERYLLTCHRYIELSPVRASMTDDPSEYRWSSYHHMRSDSQTNGLNHMQII